MISALAAGVIARGLREAKWAYLLYLLAMIIELSSVTCSRLVNSHVYDILTSYRTQFDVHGEKL